MFNKSQLCDSDVVISIFAIDSKDNWSNSNIMIEFEITVDSKC